MESGGSAATGLMKIEIDRYSQHLVQHDATDGRLPVRVYGDGNCLFRAASMAVFGNEDEHVTLRKRTASELQSHLSTYAVKCCQHAETVSSENQVSFSPMSLLQVILSDKFLQSFASVPATLCCFRGAVV